MRRERGMQRTRPPLKEKARDSFSPTLVGSPRQGTLEIPGFLLVLWHTCRGRWIRVGG